MKSLTIIILSLLLFLTKGDGQERPSITEDRDKIILRNSYLQLEIAKSTGEILSFFPLRATTVINLLTNSAYVIFTDQRDNSQYRQSDGKISNFSTANYLDSVKVIFEINFSGKLPKSQYRLQINYTLDNQALRWDVMLKTNLPRAWEAVIDFSFPVITKMSYAFWTDASAPFKLPIMRSVVYRKRGGVILGGCVIPVLILYNDTIDIGLSLVSPFELKKPGLQWQMRNDSLNISNYHLRLSKNHPAQTGIYIVPHQGDWRSGLFWLYNKYPAYFNPFNQKIWENEGWFMMVDPEWSSASLAKLAHQEVAWVEFHTHFPFLGLYAPALKDSWFIISDREGITYHQWQKDSVSKRIPHTGYKKNQKLLDTLLNHNIQPYIYFQSFEGWKEYAKKHFSNDIAIGAKNETLAAWINCYLMNPDPKRKWGKHIISQIKRLLKHYPKAAGIFYDRDDYCDYDYAHNDGITMIKNKPVYMLGFAQEQINDSILNEVHQLGKGVWTNGPTSVEVCKGMDGIMSENLTQASYLQYLGIARPLILLPYDTLPQQTEDKLKTALWTGHLPSIAWHRAHPRCLEIDERYRPLFSQYKSKKWVLYPKALQLPKGVKGNIFQKPDSDYLIALVDRNKYLTNSDPFQYNVETKIQLPDFSEIKYCYLFSGDYKGVHQIPIYNNLIKLPALRTTALLQLAKKPRYSITKTSSPVLTRGELTKLEFNIQNLDQAEMNYTVELVTPFVTGKESFSLTPMETYKMGLKFKVPKDFALGETTLKVIIEKPRCDTLIFSAWVVDLVQFQLPQKLFIHHALGDSFPFTLTNNTNRELKVKLKGSLIEGRGRLKLSAQNLILKPWEAKPLVLNIITEQETGKIQLVAKTENSTIEVISSVKKAMVFETDNYFYDDFSSGNMASWDTFGTWQIVNGMAQGKGIRHWAVKKGEFKDFQFQVNTKLLGSTNPAVDWLKSYIYFRVQDLGNFYRYGILFDNLTLYKRVKYKWYRLGQFRFEPKKNIWYNLSVEAKGKDLICYLDGEPVIRVQDTTFSSGGIGLGVFEDEMVNYYDDVLVRPLPLTTKQ